MVALDDMKKHKLPMQTLPNINSNINVVKNLTINHLLNAGQMTELINSDRYPERRRNQRIICDNPALVQDKLTRGKNYSITGRVTNMSSGGMFIVINQEIQKDTEVIVKTAFPTGSQKWGSTNLKMVGHVVRSEIQSDGKIGLGIKLKGKKFL